jgi:hypothetical protein
MNPNQDKCALSYLVYQFVYPQMTVVYELSFTNFTLIRSLFEMGSLVSAQTLYPRETFSTHVTPVWFLPGVDVLMSPQVAWRRSSY